jgi:tRNA modification GTPase
MKILRDDKPIVACSTGLKENTAIGIIRLSGFPELDYLQEFFKIDIGSIGPRYATFCKIYHNDQVLDEVVITYFKGPNSYNGENVLEIAAHGNIFNLKRIMSAFVSSGKFRMAENGEFTYRALKNKKLSLSQVEGLDTLLNASSSLMLDQGLAILNGNLNKRYHDLYDDFLKLKTSIEINIDFAEDVGEEEALNHLKKSVASIKTKINSLYQSANLNSKALLSPDVVLVGEPNAGKSSLFNKILNSSRSIVTDVAGTTRDFITEYLDINNNAFRLVDTAGLRVTDDAIEEEGIKRSISLLNESFFKVLLINVNEFKDQLYHEIESVKFDAIIFTHCHDYKNNNFETLMNSGVSADYFLFVDLVNDYVTKIYGPIGPVENSGSMGAESNTGSIEPEKNQSGPMGAKPKIGPIEPGKFMAGPIGAKTNNGPIEPVQISELVTRLIDQQYSNITEKHPVTIERHVHIINDLHDSFYLFERNINNLDDIAIVSSECNILESKIAELIGFVPADTVLNNIFSNFCIGK